MVIFLLQESQSFFFYTRLNSDVHTTQIEEPERTTQWCCQWFNTAILQSNIELAKEKNRGWDCTIISQISEIVNRPLKSRLVSERELSSVKSKQLAASGPTFHDYQVETNVFEKIRYHKCEELLVALTCELTWPLPHHNWRNWRMAFVLVMWLTHTDEVFQSSAAWR